MLLKLKKQLLMEKQTGGTFYTSFGLEEDEPRSEQRTAAVFVFRDEREELRHERTHSKAAAELKLLLHQEKVLPPSGLDVQGDIFFLGVFRKHQGDFKGLISWLTWFSCGGSSSFYLSLSPRHGAFACAITDTDFSLLKPEMKMCLRNFLICAFYDNFWTSSHKCQCHQFIANAQRISCLIIYSPLFTSCHTESPSARPVCL